MNIKNAHPDQQSSQQKTTWNKKYKKNEMSKIWSLWTTRKEKTKCISSPQEASCCFLPVPGGRPLPLFWGGGADPDPAIDTIAELPGLDPAPGLVDDRGERPRDMVPSGPYFRGLPLFLFTGSAWATLLPWFPMLTPGWQRVGEGSIWNAGPTDPPPLTFVDRAGKLVDGLGKGRMPGGECKPVCDPEPDVAMPLCM